MTAPAAPPAPWRDLLRELSGLAEIPGWDERSKRVVLAAYGAGLSLGDLSGIGLSRRSETVTRDDFPQIYFGDWRKPEGVIVTPSGIHRNDAAAPSNGDRP